MTALPDRGEDQAISLSVVVCAYTENRFGLLIECIDSVLVQLRNDDELIVVIDYNDALLRSLADHCGPDVHIIPNAQARGLSGARNSGLSVARGDVVAFVDDDAKIEPDWVVRMLHHYSRPDVVGIGGYAVPIWASGRPAWFPAEYDWVVGCSHLGLPEQVSAVRNFIGCNMSFRRAVIEKSGGFKAEVGRVGSRPVGCEETELCIRLVQMQPDSRLLFDPDIVVRHWVSEERGRPSYFLSRCFHEGVSKRMISSMVGASSALSSERKYVIKILPRAVYRYLVDAVRGRGRRRDSVARAVAVLVGLVATSIGYVYALVHCTRSETDHPQELLG